MNTEKKGDIHIIPVDLPDLVGHDDLKTAKEIAARRALELSQPGSPLRARFRGFVDGKPGFDFVPDIPGVPEFQRPSSETGKPTLGSLEKQMENRTSSPNRLSRPSQRPQTRRGFK